MFWPGLLFISYIAIGVSGKLFDHKQMSHFHKLRGRKVIRRVYRLHRCVCGRIVFVIFDHSRSLRLFGTVEIESD